MSTQDLREYPVEFIKVLNDIAREEKWSKPLDREESALVFRVYAAGVEAERSRILKALKAMEQQ